MKFSIVCPDIPYVLALNDIVKAMFYSLLDLHHDVEIRKDFNTTNRMIIFGSHRPEILKIVSYLPKNSIIYNTEQYSTWKTFEYVETISKFNIWSIFNDILGTYVPVGYVPYLTPNISSDKDIDILFYGCNSIHRSELLLSLSKNFRICFLGYDTDKSSYILRSKSVISLNYNGITSDRLAIARLFIPMHYKIATISERTDDKTDWPSHKGVFDIESIWKVCDEYKYYGEMSYQELIKFPMKNFIEKALDVK